MGSAQVRLEPLLARLQEKRGELATIPKVMSKSCEGIPISSLRRPAELLERAAAGGDSTAHLRLGQFWSAYAALKVGVLNSFPMAATAANEANLLAERYPEAAKMRDEAFGHLVTAAQLGNLDAIEVLEREATLGTLPGSAVSPELAYFWQQVLFAADPEAIARRNERYFRRDLEARASGNSQIPATTPDYYSAPESFGVSAGRATQIRAAAEAMARRCCQRKP